MARDGAYWGVVQLAARQVLALKVLGSSPSTPTFFAPIV
jgi:hypothetical protein